MAKPASAVAAALALSPTTVRNHISHCCKKLGAKDKAELVNLMLNHYCPVNVTVKRRRANTGVALRAILFGADFSAPWPSDVFQRISPLS